MNTGCDKSGEHEPEGTDYGHGLLNNTLARESYTALHSGQVEGHQILTDNTKSTK
jgi:hypothetical protein